MLLHVLVIHSFLLLISTPLYIVQSIIHLALNEFHWIYILLTFLNYITFELK